MARALLVLVVALASVVAGASQIQTGDSMPAFNLPVKPSGGTKKHSDCSTATLLVMLHAN